MEKTLHLDIQQFLCTATRQSVGGSMLSCWCFSVRYMCFNVYTLAKFRLEELHLMLCCMADRQQR